ncbi:aspartate kinase [Profundibacterium mesophilum]|uniref:aspartate kinase n=1 Tax=Profundibacterium mesophilum KAUST100406-0324 TaxID=1037889 RepID=A0A921TCE8_9RHOB|nr:aspartate kinase [Profundibacterium mesophilum]KAF0675046.1 aspartate kinase [Profundibacterium mesophilum KAUST100406-0324]
MSDHSKLTVEKIGGTSMSRIRDLVDTLFLGGERAADPYHRLFVVSAFGGITDLLLEHKKSGKPGVYALFASAESDHAWSDALSRVSEAMCVAHAEVLESAANRQLADGFVRERIEGARNCLIDLQRICSYGHFRLSQHMAIIRELLSGLGEAHSAYVTALLLSQHGINSRFIDLSGWRDDRECSLRERIVDGLAGIDFSAEMPIVTGYAQCVEGLMREFDRGYSEVTFSQIAAIMGAREAVIHKEFHLSSADPKLVGAENVRKLGHTNYDVADQLSNMGMEAIHPKAAKALRQADVPLRVTNAFEPDDPGTLIDDKPAASPGAEIVTGLDVYALELFEQDMVGVKGYDSAILDMLARHRVRIVSKTSNANTIVHYVDAPLKAIRRVERDLRETYPQAELSVRAMSIASVIGRDLSGLRVLSSGLAALEDAGLNPIAGQQTTRSVDVQFMVPRDALDAAIGLLHDRCIGRAGGVQAAA